MVELVMIWKSLFASCLIHQNLYTGAVNGNITICNFSLNNPFQVRWLVSSHAFVIPPMDVWSLDDVKIILITECASHTLLEDSFNISSLK